VACLGFPCPPKELEGFGAFFSHWENPGELEFAVQKPSVSTTLELSRSYKCLADAGIWLMNERSLRVLMEQCGWQESLSRFCGDHALARDLYGEFGLNLGESPARPLSHGEKLSATIFHPECQFFHFGTSRQVLEAATRLHQTESRSRAAGLGFLSSEIRHANQHVQNVDFEGGQNLPQDLSIWIENSYVSKQIGLSGQNFLTGLPLGDWSFTLPTGACLDLVPVGEDLFCPRFYGFDDSFSGSVSDPATLLLGEPVTRWISQRGLEDWFKSVDHQLDIQTLPIFPVLSRSELESDFISWLFNADRPSEDLASKWLNATKLSARDLLGAARVDRLYDQRRALQVKSLRVVVARRDQNMFYNMDIQRAAELASSDTQFPNLTAHRSAGSTAQLIQDFMFESEMARIHADPRWEGLESDAFRVLREMIVNRDRLAVHAPVATVLPEQIVWGRSPIRLDLAGGWTDTPPYSILHGGQVVNVAVELNGQPSIQVFVRKTERLEILLRSIDLGTQVVIREFEDLRNDVTVGSEFALARTALSLAGFSPEFSKDGGDTLRKRLANFGGGLEISMLAAVPKGSGLGTSSILSSALLATLGDVCGHKWSQQDVFTRVLASEQILTTGGGWQDQVGGSVPGLKLVSSKPGVEQNVKCHWLPPQILGAETANRTALLYYTGLTRTAKGVLREIVRGMFMNAQETVTTLKLIGQNTQPASDAIMRNSYTDLGAAVRRSWTLNRQLDSGTCPPLVEEIYTLIDDFVHGAKLLGAGGGGYMFMMCKDEDAASRCRSVLNEAKLQPGSRFVNFDVSSNGLCVTRN
jgi:galactokinase/mevalonate kinase-like predicted kinase